MYIIIPTVYMLNYFFKKLKIKSINILMIDAN
jgi:hypothetical protein